jgi:hypothetical protein
MNLTSTPLHPDPHASNQPSLQPWGWELPPDRASDVAAWLDRCEDEVVHPGVVEEQLKRSGWQPAHARIAAERYRSRFNEHTLGYSALLVATGVSALAAGTALHLLAAGLDRPVNRNALGMWLALLICALPFAAWAHLWAAAVDRDDPVSVWSRTRRTLARVLLWSAGGVGIVRLMIYARQLIGVVVGASWASGTSLATGAVNVTITVAIALPLGLWAFRFLHRFDQDDPTAPRRHRRSPAPPPARRGRGQA